MICRFCGQEGDIGTPFDRWVKPTFTDWDKLLPGDSVCDRCLFWFDEANVELMRHFGKDKPQRMRNYSHFIVNGEWFPLSKADKKEMARLLLEGPFPELATIAVSGQKHIVFRAQYNSAGGDAGWLQFEEERVWINRPQMAWLLSLIEALYTIFSKAEIETGEYNPQRIMQFGLSRWQALEQQIRPVCGSLLFSLAIFLAQRSEDGNGDIEAAGGAAAAGNLARHPGGLQEQIPDEYLGTVPESDRERGLHQQSGEI